MTPHKDRCSCAACRAVSGKHLYKCTCLPCREARAAHRKDLRHGGGAQTFTHGKLYSYQGRGCRCDKCSRVASTNARVISGGTSPKLETPRYNTKASEAFKPIRE